MLHGSRAMTIRLLIADDQQLVCDGLQAILSTVPEVEVVGVANDGAKAIEMVNTLHPDLVLMDLKMPGMNGIHATRAIRDQYPDVYVLVLTTYDADEWVFDAIRAGAAGYLLKDARREDIVAAIKGTIAGHTHVDPSVANKLFAQMRNGVAPDTSITASLSEREIAVLRLLAQGHSNAVIAERLFLAEGTIRNYVSVIFAKLGVADRTQAAALAWRHGLVANGDA
jgi:two-component system, NarL family, response regulator LiaR